MEMKGNGDRENGERGKGHYDQAREGKSNSRHR
jgi:hypothetical protein